MWRRFWRVRFKKVSVSLKSSCQVKSHHLMRLTLSHSQPQWQLCLQPRHSRLGKSFVWDVLSFASLSGQLLKSMFFFCVLKLQPCQLPTSRDLWHQISSFPVLSELRSEHTRLPWVWVWRGLITGWGEEWAKGISDLTEIRCFWFGDYFQVSLQDSSFAFTGSLFGEKVRCFYSFLLTRSYNLNKKNQLCSSLGRKPLNRSRQTVCIKYQI